MLFVTTQDLDNDHDLDIIYASSENDQVAWLENINGQGNYSAPIVLSEFARKCKLCLCS